MTDRRMQEVQDEVRRVAHAVRAQEAEDQGDGWFRCIPHAGPFAEFYLGEHRRFGCGCATREVP
jgi:hypothetical protein